MERSTSEIIGGLLTQNRKQPVTAIGRRLQQQRENPIKMIQGSIDRRESWAEKAATMNVPGSEFSLHGADVGGGGVDAPGGLTEAEFNSRLQRMMKEAPGSVSITSGKRDANKQKQLWAAALKKYGDPEIADNWVARPGTSKHESGLAADLKFASPAVKKWYHDNARKYGLHFPMGHEPWHIQLVEEKGHKGHGHAPGQHGKSAPAKSGAKSTGNPHLDYIINNESRFDPHAKNPTSSAFGIGQMIKANRIAYGKRLGYHPDTTDGMQQIAMMMEYIKDRYKTPEAAAAFKKKHGWY